MVDDTTVKALDDLSEELMRARKKFPIHRHMMEALMEEAGELAKVLMEQSRNENLDINTDEAVYKEAIQVACVAIRIATEGAGSGHKYLSPYVGDKE